MAMSMLADVGDKSDWTMHDETCASTASATDIAPTKSAAFGRTVSDSDGEEQCLNWIVIERGTAHVYYSYYTAASVLIGIKSVNLHMMRISIM